MRSGLVEAIVTGDRMIWLIIVVLWVITAALVLAQRGGRRSAMRAIALSSLATATSLSALAVATAVALPRIRWKTVSNPDLVAPKGDTWRRLRGPAVPVVVSGVPDLAVPTVDSAGRWVLFGLVSGEALPGLEPAPVATPEMGAPRICSNDSDRCRAWPARWPDPARPGRFAELLWAKDGAAVALAHDVESGLYLREVAAPEGGGDENAAIEIVGRITNDASREGNSALFVVRRIGAGRLQAMRVIASPAGNDLPPEVPLPPRTPGSIAASESGGESGWNAPTTEFKLQRADVSLRAGPAALALFARPLLIVTSLSLPASILIYFLAPLALASRLRRRSAIRRELDRSLTLVPVAGADVGGLALVADDADLGDALLTRGSVVTMGPPGASHDGLPVASRAWFEVPIARAAPWADPNAGPDSIAAAGSAISHGERGTSRKVGLLVPADAFPFRRAARAWISPSVQAAAVFATGLAAALPAIVAIVAMLGAR
jgi:hypothetical protein